MLKRGVLLIGFLSTFSLSLAQYHEAAAKTKPATETKVVKVPKKQKRTNKEREYEFIDHHLLDAHSFDIMVGKESETVQTPHRFSTSCYFL